jgi:DUF1680 family protein
MRTIASVDQLVAATEPTGLVIAQFLGGDLRASVQGGEVRVRITTDQPWEGRVEVEILETLAQPWALAIRVPAWSPEARLSSSDGAHAGEWREAPSPTDGLARIERTWAVGDRMRLDLAQEPRLTAPDRRVDAVRGSVAVEYGPIVYCVEQADVPGGAPLADIAVRDDIAPRLGQRSTDLDAPTITLEGVIRPPANTPTWPYVADPAADPVPGEGTRVSLTAVPYHRWANRAQGAMRVWIPVAED